MTIDRTEGLTKLIIDPDTERVLGVGIVGAGAGEMIAEGVLAIEMGALASDIKLCDPSASDLSETIMEAAEVFYGQSTHIYRPEAKDNRLAPTRPAIVFVSFACHPEECDSATKSRTL